MADATVLLAGGGTAGHVNPLLATAVELETRGFTVVAVGTEKGLEADLVPRAGVAFRVIPRAPLPRRPTLAALRFPWAFMRAVSAARRVIDETRPSVVVGFGGYVSTPVYVAARRARVPIVIHEANARPGFANRLGARWAARVAVTYASTALPGAVVTGLPLRPEIATLAADRRSAASSDRARAKARAALRWPEDARAVLVTGGSLGAARLNDAVAAAIPALAVHGIHVLHLTGRGKDDAALRALGDLPAKVRAQYVVREYDHDIAAAYAACDAIVCRAGAATVAEVTALGVPAVYVPLAHGNGEQELNAADAVRAGAAVVIPDDRLTAAALTLALEELLLDDGARRRMVAAARRTGIVDATARLADLIAEVAG